MIIKQVKAFEILDSRGSPTIRTHITSEKGLLGWGDAPSGASTGQYEALEKREGNLSRFHGKGVKGVLENAQPFYESLLGTSFEDLPEVEKKLLHLEDDQKTHFGANVMLSTCLALYRLHALESHQPLWMLFGSYKDPKLPVPLINVLNGGAHAANDLHIQEFMILPHGFERFSEALQAGVEIFWTLKDLLKQKGFHTGVGDEGGLAPNLKTSKEALDWICLAIQKAGFRLGEEISLGLDVAASELYEAQNQTYQMDGKKLSSKELMAFFLNLFQAYPFKSLEDPFRDEFDPSWQILTQKLPRHLIVGDDLLVTQKNRLEKAFQGGFGNAILIKPNQVGSLFETRETIQLAQKNHFTTIISHRSGETEDPFIADLAFGVQSPFIKMGSVTRSERTAKYNRFLELENELQLPLIQIEK